MELNADNNHKIKLHKIEEIVYGLCLSTLEKTYEKKSVKKDSIDKLKRLAPYVDLTLFDQLVSENIDQTMYMTSAFDSSINTRGIIEYVINNCQPFTPPGYKLDNYPVDQTTTSNGLQMEDLETYNRAMKQHLEYLENFNRVKTT
ncbi:MAG: hypothetical protein NT170_03450 [Candidatus Moranbacteria bacterium]|nr:hypothetical protein [Candidatus Moranbacteria bacterium]